jgi:MATE family multidrug resistance protein
LFKSGSGSFFRLHPLKEVFEWKGLKEFLFLSVPGFLQICLEWWVLEAISFLAGALPNAEVTIGASYIILNLESLLATALISISVYSSVRVGYHIGAEDCLIAKRAALIGLTAAGLFALLFSVIAFALRREIPLLYTEDNEIVQLASSTMVIYAVMILGDSLNMCINGVASGMGLQKMGAISQFLGYYVVGMPVCIWIAFTVGKDYALTWLWGGATLSMFSAFLIQLLIILRYDWNDAVNEARKRCDPSDTLNLQEALDI